MYKIKEYEKKYNKEINNFIISIICEEYGFEEFRDELENENNGRFLEECGKFWIAVDEQNNIIGTILIFKHDNEYMEIKKFYVRKEYRGKHIGYELYKKAIDFCKEKGVKKIIIGTYNKLESAIKFYIKNLQYL